MPLLMVPKGRYGPEGYDIAIKAKKLAGAFSFLVRKEQFLATNTGTGLLKDAIAPARAPDGSLPGEVSCLGCLASNDSAE